MTIFEQGHENLNIRLSGLILASGDIYCPLSFFKFSRLSVKICDFLKKKMIIQIIPILITKNQLFWKHITKLIQTWGWDPIKQLNTSTFVCLFQARTWISNIICHSLFCVQWVQFRWQVIVRFVDISRIVDHHCINFLFIMTEMFQCQKYNWPLSFIQYSISNIKIVKIYTW